METNTASQGRLRRTVDDLIIAELFMVQATIESANALGDGLASLGRQLTGGEQPGEAPADSLGASLQRIADSALEPYTARFRYLRELRRNS
jgi:hypothetical protein